MKNGRLFSEYRIRDAIDGRQAEAALGLRNLWNLGRGVRLGTSFERVTDLSNRAGVNTGLRPRIMAARRFRFRWNMCPTSCSKRPVVWKVAAGKTRIRISVLSAWPTKSAAVSQFWRAIFSRLSIPKPPVWSIQTTFGTYRNQHRFQIGGAYRPVRNDRWNALAKYEFRSGEDPDTTFSGALRRRVHIVSTDFNYQPSAATTLRLHYAWRKSYLDGDALNSARRRI